MTFDQAEFDIRCEWGLRGVELLAPISDSIIIVDVLSFSTCVDVAVSRGAMVFPYRYRDATAEAFADSIGGVLAGSRSKAEPSLSPASLLGIGPGTKLVLPSPNGSTLTLSTGSTPTFAGCLRNARAIARAAEALGPRIAVVPAGERWPDGSLRPAIEDWLGAGAIIAELGGSKSPEAMMAASGFHATDALASSIAACGSGKELIERGFEKDVEVASALNASGCAPLLSEGAYR